MSPKNSIFCKLLSSRKQYRYLKIFKHRLVCFRNKNFSQTKSDYERTWNSSSFHCSGSLFKKLKFLLANSVYEVTWKTSKIIARIACLRNSKFLRTDSINDIIGNISIFLSSKKFQKKNQSFPESITIRNQNLSQNFKARKTGWENLSFFESQFSLRINLNYLKVLKLK